MAGTTAYPTALDTVSTLPTAATLAGIELDGDGTDDYLHENVHGVAHEAIVAIETLLGTGAGTPTLGAVLIGTGAGTTAWDTSPTFTGVVAITDATAATSKTSGALKVTGGISTQDDVYATTLNSVTSGTQVPGISHKSPAGSYLAQVFAGADDSLADDATLTVMTRSLESGLAVISISGVTGGAAATALISFRTVSGTPRVDIISQAGGFTFEVTTADVTGTTGTDGNFGVSVRASTIELENRIGEAATTMWYIIGNRVV